MSRSSRHSDRGHSSRVDQRTQELQREQQEAAANLYRDTLAQLRAENLEQFVDTALQDITQAYEQMVSAMQNKLYAQGNNYLYTVQRIRSLPQQARAIQEQVRIKTQAQAEHAANLRKLEEQMLREAQRHAEMQQIQELVHDNPQVTHHVQAEVAQLEQLSLAQLDKLHTDVQTQLLQQQASEDVRRYKVTSILKSLREVGFVVYSPDLVQEGDQNYVLVRAARVQGNQARFKIYLDGTMDFKLDNYRGQTCKEDSDKILPLLKKVYGIDLEEQHTFWENPDDQYATARPLTSTHTSTAK